MNNSRIAKALAEALAEALEKAREKAREMWKVREMRVFGTLMDVRCLGLKLRPKARLGNVQVVKKI